MRSLPPLLLSALLLPLVAACDLGGPAPAAGPPQVAPTRHAASLADLPISVIDTGHWARTLACSGYCINEYNFWVDLRVRNDAFHKEIGVLWTRDGWATIQTAMAQYEGPLDDGFEQWGVDVTAQTSPSYQAPGEIEVAAFARMADAAHWDPHNNHYVYGKVDAARPVRRLSSEVHLEPGRGAVMTGRVRVLDLAYDKAVVVRYSTDGWATFREAHGTWLQGDDWAFRIEHVAAEPLPNDVVYAVRYAVLGQEHWDNNGGNDYRHRLGPIFEPNHTFFDLDAPLSGVLALGGRFLTDLPLGPARARVNDGPWTDGPHVVFSTATLANRPHTVEVRVQLTGGGEVSGTLPFTVRNRVAPLATWTPTEGARAAAFWGGGDYALPGAFHLPQDVAALPGGDVVILGASGPRLVRFQGALSP